MLRIYPHHFRQNLVFLVNLFSLEKINISCYVNYNNLFRVLHIASCGKDCIMATATQKSTPPALLGNSAFEQGFEHGLSWYLYGDKPKTSPTWREIVDFIRDNILDLDREDLLDDERLVDNTGFLVGWILAEYTK